LAEGNKSVGGEKRMSVVKRYNATWNPFNKWTTSDISIAIIAAAAFAGLNVAFGPISYGPYQFRVANIICLPMTVLFGYPGLIGIALGCGTTNFALGGGLLDAFSGYVMTVVEGVILVELVKRYGRTLIPIQVGTVILTVSTSLWVGWMLAFLYNLPMWFMIFTIGVTIVIQQNIIGYATVKLLLTNEWVIANVPKTLYELKQEE